MSTTENDKRGPTEAEVERIERAKLDAKQAKLAMLKDHYKAKNAAKESKRGVGGRPPTKAEPKEPMAKVPASVAGLELGDIKPKPRPMEATVRTSIPSPFAPFAAPVMTSPQTMDLISTDKKSKQAASPPFDLKKPPPAPKIERAEASAEPDEPDCPLDELDYLLDTLILADSFFDGMNEADKKMLLRYLNKKYG